MRVSASDACVCAERSVSGACVCRALALLRMFSNQLLRIYVRDTASCPPSVRRVPDSCSAVRSASRSRTPASRLCGIPA
jgi:hypothetical protein